MKSLFLVFVLGFGQFQPIILPGTAIIDALTKSERSKNAQAQLTALPDVYRVTVSRIDSNLYKDATSNTIIQTKFCFQFAIRDEAILRWEGPYSVENKLIFSDDTICSVVALR